MKKRFILIVTIAILLVSCGKNEKTQSKENIQGDKKLIHIVSRTEAVLDADAEITEENAHQELDRLLKELSSISDKKASKINLYQCRLVAD